MRYVFLAKFAAKSAVVIFSAALVGCTTTGDGYSVTPAAPAVDANLAVPCQEAAGEKYFMDPDRVIAVSSNAAGKETQVMLKVDSRDAVCTLNAKGKVTSLVDTSPKSADQLAAEEAKAAEMVAGPVKKPAKK